MYNKMMSDLSSDQKSIVKYIPANIEKKWQAEWAKRGIYKFELDTSKESYYNLVELPYPSGDLHIGHWFTFTAADSHARYQRMNGKNVFFPNGFDAFGLPAENAAIKRGIHPQDWTLSNIETMKKQFSTMGTMIDWSHEVITCLPEYYRWNQWIFLKMHEKGLAYRGKAMSNWCPSCQTVLANEGIEDGKCWRCGSQVVQKAIEQWFLKITEYADKLLWENTDEGKSANGVDWPKSVREGQNNWIGRSEGAEIEFEVENSNERIRVFTTRADTLFGATFLVVAPEHQFVEELIRSKKQSPDPNYEKVIEYVKSAKKKTEMDRKAQKEKSGVFSGAYAINPINSQRLPIWIADYVLAGYGTGAIMAVPGHDARDFEFAKKYDLPTVYVIKGKGEDGVKEEAFVGDGVLVNSGEYDGQTAEEAKKNISKYLESISKGNSQVVYHLRDWSVSRQRYWGTPVPMIHCGKCGVVPVRVEDLPIELPYEVDYMPKGEPPLATAREWVNVSCPRCGGEAKRDTETMDTFFDSSWYYYRYVSPHFEDGPFDKLRVAKLLPVDIYYGGSEHTLGHTLYARFFTKFFHDLGLVDFEEFAKKRIQHGVILGPDGFRMSKSRGNVVNPDDVVREYGADTVRMYLAFMMPYEATAPWNLSAISGVYRFLRRVWEMHGKLQRAEGEELSGEDRRQRAMTIKAVGEDIRDIKFNTAIARLMEWLNYLSRKESISSEEYRAMILLIAPFAPHIAEELFQVLQKTNSKTQNIMLESVHLQAWPAYDEADLVQDSVTIVIQVNGKVRDNIVVQSAESREQRVVEEKARASEKIKKYLASEEVKKVIFISGRAINFVV